MTTNNPSIARPPSPQQAPRPCLDDGRTQRDQWIHEFRNALGNATVAASAARHELGRGQSVQVEMLMRRIEEGCERCLRLLATMPP